jgi:hypothetical protein
MSDVLADLEAMLKGMSDKDKAELDKLIEAELKQPWLPTPGPQTDAYYSQADLLLFGGSAGGGKSSLLMGTALTAHTNTVIFRRAYVDIRGLEEELVKITGSRTGYNGSDKVYRNADRVIEFGALEKPGAEFSWQGRPHDFIGFDEGAQLNAAKVQFVLGWMRTTKPGQRCRAVIASNPPMGGEGEWLIKWFAPWLDPMYPNPAKPGELRWCVQLGDDTIWVDGPGEHDIGGQVRPALSRTFIPSKLSDNPYLRDTGYRERLENLPEPLRSQLINGDFLAGREDHEWQVIPTAWVKAAQDRWLKAPEKRRTMIALAGDIALGGKDDVVLAPLYEDAWFGPLITVPGADFKDPADIGDLMLKHRRDGADLSVDGTGGWGSGVKSRLKTHHEIDCASIVFSAESAAKTKDGKLGFVNLRAEMLWKLREALDPESGDDPMLPPDPRILAELTTPRYRLRRTDILVESKDEIRKRLGTSTDRGDAIMMAWHRRKAAIKAIAAKAKLKPRIQPNSGGQHGWLSA